MRRVRFLHCADIHLDRPFVGLDMPLEKIKQRREELKKSFKDIFDIALKEDVDFILIAGDMFEHKYIRNSTVAFIKSCFKSVSPIKVYICGGNHDPIVKDWVHEELEGIDNVFWFGEGKRVCIEEKGYSIYGEGFVDFYKDRFDGDWIKEVDGRQINVLLTHGTLEGSVTGGAYHSIAKRELESLGMDYVALGHFHKRFEDPSREQLYFNPGSLEPLGFDEVGEHGVFLAEIKKWDNGIEKQVEFIATNKRSYKRISVDVTGCSNEEECICKIEENLLDVKFGDFLSICLEGFLERDVYLDLRTIKMRFENYYYFKIEDCTLIDICIQSLKEDRTIKGEFARRVIKKLESSQNQDLRKNYWKALYIGLEVLTNGRVYIERYFK